MNAPQDFSLTLVSVFRAVLAASWQGSLAIVLVLLVRWVLGARAPARWHYLLWSLVLVRLLVPAFALPRNPASLENIPVLAHPFQGIPSLMTDRGPSAALAAPELPTQVADSFAAEQPPAHPSAVLPTATKPWSKWMWAALVWIGGVFAFGSWLVVSAIGFYRRLRRETFPVPEDIESIWRVACRRWLRRTPPAILAADWIASPALVGLWRPTLLLPRPTLSSFSSQDWEHVFVHEIAHLRRRDHWSQLLLLVAWCVHWFNPFVWIGLRRLRADRELAADEWALQRLESERTLAYGETLLKTLDVHPGSYFQPGLVGISEDGAQMKQRLRRIAAFLPRRLYGSLAGLAAVLALGTILLGQSATPIVKTADPQVRKEGKRPAVLSGPTAASKASNLVEEILSAARAGDSKKVGQLLHRQDMDNDPELRAYWMHGAVQMLDDLLTRRELPAFSVVLDEIRKNPLGKDWKVSDASLTALVKEGRTDFLDALLARGFDLHRLSQQAEAADPPTAAWIQRRVAEVAEQRADIDALGKAASDGDLATLRRLLDAGVDVNSVGKDNNTPLIRAVFKDRLEAAQFLLDHGADVNKPRFPGWDYTPLCLVHSVPMAELLKKAGANVQARLFDRDVSILTYVAVWSTPEVVAWFLQQGLDPKMTGDDNETLLFYLKDPRTAELLLDLGVDPNHASKSGDTAICTVHSAEVVQKLVDHGAKVNHLPDPLLPRMVTSGSAEAMKVVLKAGADHDLATLQKALFRADHLSKEDSPDKDKIKELLIGLGAKPDPAWATFDRNVLCQAKVTMADGTFIDPQAVSAYYYQTFGPQSGGSASGEVRGDPEGVFPIWILTDAATASFAVTREGYATVYAGPFTPPFKEKIEGAHVTLAKGFSAAIQIVNEAGQPIAGAKLKSYYPGPPLLNLGNVSTDVSGSGIFDHIGSAALNVQVSADGYQSEELSDIHLDATKPVRWTLEKARPLSGSVTSLATGQPIPGASIKLAGVRGPHNEVNADPRIAPLLATADAQGHFTLTTLRNDSRYFLFVEAPGRGGVLLGDVTAGHAALKVALGPELVVHGKVIHIPAGLMRRGEVHAGYDQYFKIGDGQFAIGQQVKMQPKDGEAEFTIGPLYAVPVNIQIGNKEVKLDTKDLPKSNLVIDLAPPPALP